MSQSYLNWGARALVYLSTAPISHSLVGSCYCVGEVGRWGGGEVGGVNSWGTSSLLYGREVEVKVKSLSRVWLFATPWTVTYKVLPSMEFQARVLEWVAISFSRESSRPRDRTRVSFIASRCFYPLSHSPGVGSKGQRKLKLTTTAAKGKI